MILHLREDYKSDSLKIGDMDSLPSNQFHHWFQDALKAEIKEPNAMTLATVTPEGKPSARVVLLKDYGPEGFTFFTNYDSKKGKELAQNPAVALVFLWLGLHRQVRIEGMAERLSAEASEAYFQSRPRRSQVGAWASPQSTVLESRDWLLTKVKSVEKKYKGQEKLPLPEYWGGYLVRPTLFEFWQGQTSRLHDRFQYTKSANGNWVIERLAP
ncbi:MAG: pyridoxamine 5'-phosphate oxidase [Bacteroidetes bacterium]|nr:pyridoxamine 5'-phosphate oxidase [Bacteroidota bacterium]